MQNLNKKKPENDLELSYFAGLNNISFLLKSVQQYTNQYKINGRGIQLQWILM